MISKRAQLIDASGIRKVFDLAAKMKNPVNLSIGQPDFDIPDPVKLAGIQAIEAGFNRYTPSQGIPELNHAVRDYLRDQTGFSAEASMITSGVSGGLLLAILALVDNGDEVVFPDPYFVMYKHLVNLAAGVPRPVDHYPDFALDPERIAAAITPRTKLLILNSPNNPTGAVYGAEALQAVAELARKHDLLVISDEIYRTFSYDGDCPSIASYYPEKTLVLDGFSKSSAMTGWRVGYAAGPKWLIEEMIKLQQYTFVCSPSFAQKAAVAALKMGNPHCEDYGRRRDRIFQGLVDAGYEVQRPGGAFYIFPKCPFDPDRFITDALEQSLLIIPGDVFSDRKGHFRICFTAEEKVLEQGIDILKKIRNTGGGSNG